MGRYALLSADQQQYGPNLFYGEKNTLQFMHSHYIIRWTMFEFGAYGGLS